MDACIGFYSSSPKWYGIAHVAVLRLVHLLRNSELLQLLHLLRMSIWYYS